MRLRTVVAAPTVAAVLLVTAGIASPVTVGYLTGDSMDPTISGPSIGVCSDVDGLDDVDLRDIVSVRLPSGETVAHRVILIDPAAGEIVTQGDNMSRPDPRVSIERVRCGYNHWVSLPV